MTMPFMALDLGPNGRIDTMAKRGKKWEKKLSTPERHQLRIARETLKLHDAMVPVMGGPSKAEAREIIRRYEMTYGRNPGKSGRGSGTRARLKRHRAERAFTGRRKVANPPMKLAAMALAGFAAYLLYKKYKQA